MPIESAKLRELRDGMNAINAKLEAENSRLRAQVDEYVTAHKGMAEAVDRANVWLAESLEHNARLAKENGRLCAVITDKTSGDPAVHECNRCGAAVVSADASLINEDEDLAYEADDDPPLTVASLLRLLRIARDSYLEHTALAFPIGTREFKTAMRSSRIGKLIEVLELELKRQREDEDDDDVDVG